jgi:hypothetical protein
MHSQNHKQFQRMTSFGESNSALKYKKWFSQTGESSEVGSAEEGISGSDPAAFKHENNVGH